MIPMLSVQKILWKGIVTSAFAKLVFKATDLSVMVRECFWIGNDMHFYLFLALRPVS